MKPDVTLISAAVCRNEKKVMETTTFTVFPVCVLSPSPLPKSPEACETETDVTPERSDALMKTLRDKHSQRQSRPRRRTDARPPESFPPPSALRSHPENTHRMYFISRDDKTISHHISFLWKHRRGGTYERNDSCREEYCASRLPTIFLRVWILAL